LVDMSSLAAHVGGLAFAEGPAANGVSMRWVIASGTDTAGNGSAWIMNAPGMTPAGTAAFPGRPVWSAPTFTSAPKPAFYLGGGLPGPGGMLAGYAFDTATGADAGDWHFPASAAENRIGPVFASHVTGTIPRTTRRRADK